MSTFVMMWVIRWEESVTKVVRTVPMYSRPAIFFFCHTPNDWFISVDVSDRSRKGRLCFWANFAWLAGESLLIPMRVYPRSFRSS